MECYRTFRKKKLDCGPYVLLPWQFPKLVKRAGMRGWSATAKILQRTRVADAADLARLLHELDPSHSFAVSIFTIFEEECRQGGAEGRAEADALYSHTIAGMIALALELPQLFPYAAGAADGGAGDCRVPLMLPGVCAQITLSQRQCAALLCASFFGLLVPPPLTYIHKDLDWPALEIQMLFNGRGPTRPALRCIMHYFYRVTQQMPDGHVTIDKRACAGQVAWGDADGVGATPMCELVPHATGTIEGSGQLIHADFANAYIGGGVLEGGCVQEEILFSIKPECLVSMLMCAKMEDNESIHITGAEQFSAYSGYARSFRYGGDVVDGTPRDEHGRRRCVIVAMDAVMVSFAGASQWEGRGARDLLKAYQTFLRWRPLGRPPAAPSSLATDIDEAPGGIATGNWGCGAFGGDRSLKTVQQWMAASASGHPSLHYYTFGEKHCGADLARLIERANELAHRHALTIRDLWGLIAKGNLFERLEDHCKELAARGDAGAGTGAATCAATSAESSASGGGAGSSSGGGGGDGALDRRDMDVE